MCAACCISFLASYTKRTAANLGGLLLASQYICSGCSASPSFSRQSLLSLMPCESTLLHHISARRSSLDISELFPYACLMHMLKSIATLGTCYYDVLENRDEHRSSHPFERGLTRPLQSAGHFARLAAVQRSILYGFIYCREPFDYFVGRGPAQNACRKHASNLFMMCTHAYRPYLCRVL